MLEDVVEEVFAQDLDPGMQGFGDPEAYDAADLAAERAFERALAEGLSPAEAGQRAWEAAEQMMPEGGGANAPEFGQMEEIQEAADTAFERLHG